MATAARPPGEVEADVERDEHRLVAKGIDTARARAHLRGIGGEERVGSGFWPIKRRDEVHVTAGEATWCA